MHTNPPRPAEIQSESRRASRPHPLLIAAALAVILFCAVGTAAIMGWLPSSKGGTRNQLTDADRAALASGLQQPQQQAYAPAPPPLTPSVTAAVGTAAVATAPLATAPLAAAPAYSAGYAAAPNAPASSYGSSGSRGTGAAGYDAVPAEPARSAPLDRVAETDSGSRWCGVCGNVEAVRTITTRARPSGVGAAGGAILGGLLGNQVGGGHGRQLATVAGAVGGAVMGNQVEGNMHASHSYEIRVRLDDGTLRTFHQQSAPRWRSGDRVRIVKGALRAA